MRILAVSFVVLIFSEIVFANEDENISNDSLAVLIERAERLILDEVIYEDPTANRTIGFMFNPIASITYTAGLRLIGGISYFPKNTKNEFSINYNYEKESDDDDYHLRIDVLNRFYFDRKYRKGFHVLTGLRYASYESSDGSFFNFDYDHETHEASMLGLGFGIGYRIFNKNGWYWGTSLYLGRNFMVDSTQDDESNTYMFMELFKIGYLFK